MRVVVFSADPVLESTPWWRALVATPGVAGVLLCMRQRQTSGASVLRGLRRNVRKHGVVWIPYRATVFAGATLRRLLGATQPGGPPLVTRVPIERLYTSDLHSGATLDRVRAFAPDLGVSLGAPILKRALFSLPRYGTLNMHLGTVPDFRGAPVGFWEMAAAAPTVGATIHWIDDGLDSGPIVAAGEAPIYDRDDLEDIQQRAGELGSRLLRAALAKVIAGDRSARSQPAAAGAANTFPTLRQRASVALRSLRRRLATRSLPRWAAKSALIAVALYVFRPLRDARRSLRRSHPVRVFTFHRVTNLCRDGMTVNPRVFREQIRYIARHHDIVPLDRALALLRDGARLARPAAVITFDDGYRSVFEAARPVLASHGATGCCFITTDLVGTAGRFPHDTNSPVRDFMDVMNWDELGQLVREGWHVESHTASHPRISACHGAQLRHELEAPRRVLRDRLDVAADVLAYPFGAASDFSDEALRVARDCGYREVFSNHKGENHPGSRPEILARIDLGGDHGALAWRMLSHGVDLGQLRGRRAHHSGGRAPLVAVART